MPRCEHGIAIIWRCPICEPDAPDIDFMAMIDDESIERTESGLELAAEY
jgi:hypothetical protein